MPKTTQAARAANWFTSTINHTLDASVLRRGLLHHGLTQLNTHGDAVYLTFEDESEWKIEKHSQPTLYAAFATERKLPNQLNQAKEQVNVKSSPRVHK